MQVSETYTGVTRQEMLLHLNERVLKAPIQVVPQMIHLSCVSILTGQMFFYKEVVVMSISDWHWQYKELKKHIE